MVDYYIDKDANGGASGGDGSLATPWSGSANGGQVAIDLSAAFLNNTNSNDAQVHILAGNGEPYRCKLALGGSPNAQIPCVYQSESVGQKTIITAMDDANGLDNATDLAYQWNGPNGNGEYYLTIGDATTVVPVEVKNAVIDGYYMGSSADDDRTPIGRQRGTVGALLDGQFGWGNTEGLSGDTVYVKFSDAPSNHTIEINRRPRVIDTGFLYNEFNDLVLVGGDSSTTTPRDAYVFRRCAFFAPDFNAFEGNAVTAIATKAISCIFVWAGHRAWTSAVSGNALEIYQCTEVYAHLGGRLGNAGSSLTIRNSISAFGEAGGIDNSAGGTLDEDYNLWYPFMNANGGALSYPSGNVNWGQTGDSSIPPQALGTINDPADLTDPQFSNIDPDVFNPEGLRLLDSSPAKEAGTDWWTGIGESEPLDYFGNSLSDPLNPPMGAFFEFVSSGATPTLTTPYSTVQLVLGDSGSIDAGSNWSGASSFIISQLPSWASQDGTTGTINYTDACWGTENSDVCIGDGIWDIQVQAIDSSGLIKSEGNFYLRVGP